MRQVFQEAVALSRRGEPFVIATVVRTKGSTHERRADTTSHGTSCRLASRLSECRDNLGSCGVNCGSDSGKCSCDGGYDQPRDRKSA